MSEITANSKTMFFIETRQFFPKEFLLSEERHSLYYLLKDKICDAMTPHERSPVPQNQRAGNQASETFPSP